MFCFYDSALSRIQRNLFKTKSKLKLKSRSEIILKFLKLNYLYVQQTVQSSSLAPNKDKITSIFLILPFHEFQKFDCFAHHCLMSSNCVWISGNFGYYFKVKHKG